MAIAVFYAPKGKSSAVIGVKPNALNRAFTPAYCALAGIAPEHQVNGTTFEIPDGYQLVPMHNAEGEPITSQDGTQLMELYYPA